MAEEQKYVWLFDALGNALDDVDQIDIFSRFSIDFDQWYWGNTPALVRRGEYVVQSDSIPKRFGGSKPLVSLDDIKDRFAEIPEIGEPFLQEKGCLTYQRFHGFLPNMNLYRVGIRMWPLVEHVEIRDYPFLAEEFYGRLDSEARLGGVPSPRVIPIEAPIISL